MDCGTCASASPITLEKPKIVAVNLTITDNAQVMLADAGLGYEEEEDMKLLIGVLSGGCSGYMYDLQIVEDAEDCQELFIFCDRVPTGGFHVLVPNIVSHLLDGIEIDYEDKLMGGGFKINNPNAQSSCGCGESFA